VLVWGQQWLHTPWSFPSPSANVFYPLFSCKFCLLSYMLHQPQTHHIITSLRWKPLKHTFNFFQAHTIEIVKTLETSHAQTHFNFKKLTKALSWRFQKACFCLSFLMKLQKACFAWAFSWNFKRLASLEFSHTKCSPSKHFSYITLSYFAKFNVLEQLELTQIWAEIQNATKIGAFPNFTPPSFFVFIVLVLCYMTHPIFCLNVKYMLWIL
jgi:hypothetical protein